MANKLTFAVPVEWSSQTAYEVNMIVFVGKRAYTAIQNVPVGTEITNTAYWVETGVPDIDVQALRDAIAAVAGAVDSLETTVSGIDSRVTTNSGNIATLTTGLATAQAQIHSAQATIDNIMVSLYKPYEPTQNGE